MGLVTTKFMFEKAGVKFVYNCRILGPVMFGSRVAGIETENGIEYAALESVADGVVEYRDSADSVICGFYLFDIGLVSHKTAVDC